MKTGRLINCKTCDKSFYAARWEIKGYRKYCSEVCFHKSRENKPAWNKGIKGSILVNKTSFKATGRIYKGTMSEYKHLHYWINKKMGKANSCSFDLSHSSSRFEWANVSYSYLRDVGDWIQLCKKCHYEYDKVRRGDVYA